MSNYRHFEVTPTFLMVFLYTILLYAHLRATAHLVLEYGHQLVRLLGLKGLGDNAWLPIYSAAVLCLCHFYAS